MAIDLLTKSEQTTQFSPSLDVCRNCKWSLDLRTMDKNIKVESFVCRRYPPTTVVLPQEKFHPTKGRMLVPEGIAVSPNVGADWTCGEFTMKLAVMN